MSVFCLHANPEALAPLNNSIVDNPLINSRARTRPTLHSSHIMASEQSRFHMVDLKVWSVMQEQVFQTPIHDVNDLKQRLLDVWPALDKRIIVYFVNLNFDRQRSNTHIF